MKKIFITILLSLGTFLSFGQIQTTNIKGTTVIIPSLENIITLSSADNAYFRSTMSKSNYKLVTDGSGYCASSLYFTYFIQRETAGMMWFFDNDYNNLVSNLRREIKTNYSKKPVYTDGFEFYFFKLQNGTVLKIGLQEQNDGGASVITYLE